MKVTIEVDCTPEEARRAMGLPDVAQMQEGYLATLAGVAEGRFQPEFVDAMLKGWAPMGEAGMALWRALADASVRSVDAKR